MKKIKFLIFFIVISFSLFCLEKEENLLIGIKKIKESNKNIYNTFHQAISEEAIMDKFKGVIDKKMEKDLRKVYFNVLNKYAEDISSLDKYYRLSNLDFEEVILILEKAIYLERNVDSIELNQLESYYDDGAFYSIKLSKETSNVLNSFSNELTISMLNQIMKSSSMQGINDEGIKSIVEIGIPTKDSLFSIEKEQNYIEEKDESITFVYTFINIKPKKYKVNYILCSPSGKIKSENIPLDFIITNNSEPIQNWYWNYNYVSDLEKEKGAWKMTLVIDNNEVRTDEFIVK